MVKTCIFLEESDPLRQFALAGGGGSAAKKMLGVRMFLALRQLPALARGGGPNGVRVCVKLAGAMQSIFRSYGGSFPSVWQSGKEHGGKSQIIVI
jgi:hypothetical protein